MKGRLIDPEALPTFSFDWGLIKPLVTRADTPTGALSVIEVVVLPGQGHERHNHPDAEELLFVLSGEGEQMLDDEEPFPVRAGQAIVVPKGAWHSTINTGWSPMRVLAVYAPAGPEELLAELTGFHESPAGELVQLRVTG